MSDTTLALDLTVTVTADPRTPFLAAGDTMRRLLLLAALLAGCSTAPREKHNEPDFIDIKATARKHAMRSLNRRVEDHVEIHTIAPGRWRVTGSSGTTRWIAVVVGDRVVEFDP